jgi:hypothetical protein
MHIELTISAPTYVGDTLRVLVNQRGETVAVFTPVRLIRGREFVAS